MQTKQRLDIPLNLKSVSDSGNLKVTVLFLALRTATMMWWSPEPLPQHSRNGAKKGAACVALAAPHG